MLRVLTEPVKLSPERVKVPMVAMMLSCLSGPRPSRPPMAIGSGRRSTPHLLAGWSAAEDGGRAAFLPREE
jgi:hypothetical protein